MMFLDCPAYLDENGARRCGLPAEVRCRFTMRSSDGPLEALMIRCPAGHWFTGPIASLTWETQDKHHRGEAAAASSATGHLRDGPDHGGPDRPTAHPPTARARAIARPTTAPAYYLGRPAHIWLTATSPRRRRKPAAAAPNPTAEDQPRSEMVARTGPGGS
jgi:hypothetical protein